MNCLRHELCLSARFVCNSIQGAKGKSWRKPIYDASASNHTTKRAGILGISPLLLLFSLIYRSYVATKLCIRLGIFCALKGSRGGVIVIVVTLGKAQQKDDYNYLVEITGQPTAFLTAVLIVVYKQKYYKQKSKNFVLAHLRTL